MRDIFEVIKEKEQQLQELEFETSCLREAIQIISKASGMNGDALKYRQNQDVMPRKMGAQVSGYAELTENQWR